MLDVCLIYVVCMGCSSLADDHTSNFHPSKYSLLISGHDGIQLSVYKIPLMCLAGQNPSAGGGGGEKPPPSPSLLQPLVTNPNNTCQQAWPPPLRHTKHPPHLKVCTLFNTIFECLIQMNIGHNVTGTPIILCMSRAVLF